MPIIEQTESNPSLDKPLIVAALISLSSRRPLIHFVVHCDEHPIKATVDTGSMMNIVSRRVWESCILRPYDKSEKVEIIGANN